MNPNQSLNPDEWKTPGFRERIIQQFDAILQKSPPGTTGNVNARDIEAKIFNTSPDKDHYINAIKKFIGLIRDKGNQQMRQQQQQPPGSLNQGIQQRHPQQQQHQQVFSADMHQGSQQSHGIPMPQGMQQSIQQGIQQNPSFSMQPQQYQQQTSQQQMGQYSQQQQHGHMSGGQGVPVPVGATPGGQFSQQIINPQSMPIHQTVNQHRQPMLQHGLGMQQQTLATPGGQQQMSQGNLQTMQINQQMQQRHLAGQRIPVPYGPMGNQQGLTPEIRNQLLHEHQNMRMRMHLQGQRTVNPNEMFNQQSQAFSQINRHAGPVPSLQPQQVVTQSGQGGQTGGLLYQLINNAPSGQHMQSFRPQMPPSQPPGYSPGPNLLMPGASPVDPRISQMGMTNSPLSSQEIASVKPGDELYVRKLEELKKYHVVIQRMTARHQADPARREQIQKLTNLQRIISNPTSSTSYEMLLKCEVVVKAFFGGNLDSDIDTSPEMKTPASIPGLSQVPSASMETLIKVDRASLKPAADALSRACSSLTDDQFTTLCQALHARLPGHLEDDLQLPPLPIQLIDDDEDDIDMNSDIMKRMKEEEDNDPTMSEQEKLEHRKKQREVMTQWMKQIPYELQMEVGYQLHEFAIVLDPDMHPNAEISPESEFIYLCCGMKHRTTPPIGVAVPKDYPKSQIDFKEMDVSGYDKIDELLNVKKLFREILLDLGAEMGCSLTTIFKSWREAVTSTRTLC